jgi:hypothetical protein
MVFFGGDFYISNWNNGKFISGTTYGMVWNNGVSDYECLYNVFGMMELGEMETGMDHIST